MFKIFKRPEQKWAYDGLITADVERALYCLGAMTADEIATWLDHRGIKGRRVDGTKCPISNAIKAMTGQRIMIGSHSARGVDRAVGLPQSVIDFTTDFDGTTRYTYLLS